MRSIAAFLIILSAASISWAGKRTDLENWERAVGRAAPLDPAKGKILCACVESAFPVAGRLFRNDQVSGNVQLFCGIPVFDLSGGEQLVNFIACRDFILIR